MRPVVQDDEKELFFRNFLWRGSPPTNFFEIMQAFYHGDGRPAFPIHIPWLESAVRASCFLDHGVLAMLIFATSLLR